MSNTNTITNCRIRPAKKPTLNEYKMARPYFTNKNALMLLLMYDEYIRDHYGALAADEEDLDLELHQL